MINYYLLSLAVADLLCGLFVVPLSVYPAITGRWMFGDLMCRLAGYVEVTLWSVSVYTFMWISVDRYLAVRKPLRYETVSATVVILFNITYQLSTVSSFLLAHSIFKSISSHLTFIIYASRATKIKTNDHISSFFFMLKNTSNHSFQL